MKTIDTRDLYTRKCELEDLRDAVTAAREELTDAGFPAGTMRSEMPADLREALESAEADYGEDEQAELAELENLESEIGNLRNGETLIRECDFEAYAQELAEDITPGFREASWPFICIDWEQAAKALAQDYTSVTYQGEEYLIRA